MQTLRQAARTLTSQPGTAVLAVVMLTLGIGASTAIFSIVNAVLLRPLPYAGGDELVWVWSRDTRRSVQQWASYPDFNDWRARSRTLSRILGSLLFGIQATDPATFVAVTLLLVLVALAACLVPARKATPCDPLVALRHQ